MMILLYFPDGGAGLLRKAHVKGHWRTDRKTGKRVWVEPFERQDHGRGPATVTAGSHFPAVDALLSRVPQTRPKGRAFPPDPDLSDAELADAARQYQAVEARYRGTDQWLKAPNGQPTKLTEGQWVRVRTPVFKAWFGDWETRAQAARLRDVTGSGLARRAAMAFVGKPLVNAGTGLVATVSRTSLDKMLSRAASAGSVSAQAHMMAVANLDRLFSYAVARGARPPKKAQDVGELAAVHHFDAPMPFGGDLLRVKIMAKQFVDPEKGSRIYLVQSVKIEDAEVVGGDPGVSGRFRAGDAPDSPPPLGVTSSFDEAVRAVKGDGVSKVVDDNGEPLVVYRGVERDYGPTVGAGAESHGRIFFTDSREEAAEYANRNPEAAHVLPVFLRIVKPMRNDEELTRKQYAAERRDGQIYPGTWSNGATYYVADSASQAKSAIGNAGTYRTDRDELVKALPSAKPRPDHGPHLPAYRDALRAKLADLAALQRQVAGTDRAIRQAAGDRLTAVQRELHHLAPKAVLDDEAGERYRALVLERARLHRLLS